MTINASAYALDIYYGEKVIGSLTADQHTNLLKLEYSDDWRNYGFALSPSLPLNHLHKPEEHTTIWIIPSQKENPGNCWLNIRGHLKKMSMHKFA